MTKVIYAVSALLGLGSLPGCSMSQEKAEIAPQVVEFTEAEVPHIVVISKDGKMTAEIVDSTVTKVTAK